jgi:hypothetical protein
MPKVTGTVSKGESRERVAAAIVRARSEAGEAKLASTGDGGGYAFDDLAAGKWTLTAIHESFQASAAHQIDVAGQELAGVDLKLVPAMSTEDKRLGAYMFAGLIAGLLILIATYIVLHREYRPERKPLSDSLLVLIGQTESQLTANAAAGTPVAAGQAANLRKSTDAILTEFEGEIDEAERAVVGNTLDQIELAVSEGRGADAAAAVNALGQMISGFDVNETDVLWRDPPGRYFEILFWATAGVLVSLISTVAYYLRFNRFYREGWPLHVAQLAIGPVVTLVIVTCLSLSALNATVGSSEIDLDLDDPVLLAVVSFLVAFVPWSAMKWVRGASARILRQDPLPTT